MIFRALRAARLGRTLLLAAAFVATAGSFGLHPEPESVRAAAASDSRVAAWTAVPADAGGADGCTACLVHRTISLTDHVVFSPTGAPILDSPLVSTARRLRLFQPRLDDGRAPPTRL